MLKDSTGSRQARGRRQGPADDAGDRRRRWPGRAWPRSAAATAGAAASGPSAAAGRRRRRRSAGTPGAGRRGSGGVDDEVARRRPGRRRAAQLGPVGPQHRGDARRRSAGTSTAPSAVGHPAGLGDVLVGLRRRQRARPVALVRRAGSSRPRRRGPTSAGADPTPRTAGRRGDARRRGGARPARRRSGAGRRRPSRTSSRRGTATCGPGGPTGRRGTRSARRRRPSPAGAATAAAARSSPPMNIDASPWTRAIGLSAGNQRSPSAAGRSRARSAAPCGPAMRSKIAPPIARRTSSTAIHVVSLERLTQRRHAASDGSRRPAGSRRGDRCRATAGRWRATPRRSTSGAASSSSVARSSSSAGGRPVTGGGGGRRGGDERQRMRRRRVRRAVEGVRRVDRPAVGGLGGEERPRPGRQLLPAAAVDGELDVGPPGLEARLLRIATRATAAPSSSLRPRRPSPSPARAPAAAAVAASSSRRDVAATGCQPASPASYSTDIRPRTK